MSATAKFYAGFFLGLALVIWFSFYTGYRAGQEHERAASHDARRLVPSAVPTVQRASAPSRTP